MRKLELATTFAMLKVLTEEERAEVRKFEASAVAKKMAELGPVIERLELLMANEGNPDLDAAVQEAGLEVLQRRLTN